MVLWGMDQHYSHTFTTFCEMKKDNWEQSVLIDSSELQSVTDYSKMCHCRSENVTQLLLITEAVMVQSVFFVCFFFLKNEPSLALVAPGKEGLDELAGIPGSIPARFS